MIMRVRRIYPAAAMMCLIPMAAFCDLIAPSRSTITVTAGETFSLTATVTDIQDLYAFQFDWDFDPAVLMADSISEGTFLPAGGSTFFISGNIDNAGGNVADTADSLLGAVSGVDGSGVLAIATFTAKSAGTTSITLPNQILLDNHLNPIVPKNAPESSCATLLAFALATIYLTRKVICRDEV